jgi:Cof subfamily protein (haloacid dehalogenase superfamily)
MKNYYDIILCEVQYFQKERESYMNYKLLCTDMDGTLLNDKKEIGKKTLDAIKKAEEKGVKVVISTGRLFTSAEAYANIVGVKAPIISSNGAYIREKDRDEVIYKSLLGEENCLFILKILKKYGMIPNYHTPDAIYTEESDSAYFKMYAIGNSTIKVNIVTDWDNALNAHKYEIVKCIAVEDDLEKLSLAKAEMSANESLEVVSSHYNNFEVMQKGVSKGRAVEILAAYYGIKKEEIICIGDNENDLTMIEYAGLGVAMGNSSEAIKAIANYVTLDNNEDGVAKVIEEFILKEK